MSNFTEVLGTDAVNAFTAADAFGEAVTYTPLGTGSSSTIYAIIDRNPPEKFELGERGMRLRAAITVALGSSGITLSSFDSGKATVQFPTRVGGTSLAYRFSKEPVVQDAGMVRFLLE